MLHGFGVPSAYERLRLLEEERLKAAEARKATRVVSGTEKKRAEKEAAQREKAEKEKAERAKARTIALGQVAAGAREIKGQYDLHQAHHGGVNAPVAKLLTSMTGLTAAAKASAATVPVMGRVGAMLAEKEAAMTHASDLAAHRRALELDGLHAQQQEKLQQVAQHQARQLQLQQVQQQGRQERQERQQQEQQAQLQRQQHDAADRHRKAQAIEATVQRVKSTALGVAGSIYSALVGGGAGTGGGGGAYRGAAGMPVYSAPARGPAYAANSVSASVAQHSVVAQPMAPVAGFAGVGGAGQPIQADAPPPGLGIIQASTRGFRTKDKNGELLPYQRLALDALAGTYTGVVPGTQPIRSLLVFHSMGSGKTPTVHAVLNYLTGVAGQSIEGVQQPVSLVCRVALLWQTSDMAREQEQSLRRNKYRIFSGYDTTRVEPGNIYHGTIEEKANIDELKTQLQIPSASWKVNFDAMKKLKEANSSAGEKGTDQLESLRHKLDRLDDLDMDPSKLKRMKAGLLEQIKLADERHKGAAEKEGATKDLMKRAQMVWPCNSKNPVLFIVDECHKLLSDTNPAYPLLRACVACDHAKVLLMSGTPITSVEPMKEFVRICMLIGGKAWILAALRLSEPPPARIARRVEIGCAYDTLKSIMFGKDGLHVTASTLTNKLWDAHQLKTDSTMAGLYLQLSDAETIILRHLADRGLSGVDELLNATPVLNISYYGRINGNLAAHEAFRDDFSYNFIWILDLLRRTHVASVPGTTQVLGGMGDANFEAIDGETFTNTVDPRQYYIVNNRVVARGGAAALLPGPPAHSNAAWHSVREFVPAFLPNRRMRCLHVSVPSFYRQKILSGNDLVPADKHDEATDVYVYDHTFAWLETHMNLTAAWTSADREARVYQMKGGHSTIYEMVWALAVVYVTACACVFEADADHRTNMVVYVDRGTYGLQRAQIELLIHAVFDGSMGHKLHDATQHPGVPYAGAGTKKDGRLSYQIGWESEIDPAPRTLSQWISGFGEDPKKKSRVTKESLQSTIESFGPLFALDLDAALKAAASRTTQWDEEMRSDVSDQRTSKSHMSLHVLFKDMFVTEARGMSLSTEGDDLGMFGALFILGVPSEMTSQRMEQLFDRVNRVNTQKTTKTKKFVMCATRPDVLNVSIATPLRVMGATEKDILVNALNAALVRNAGDCGANRTHAEAQSFACRV